MWACGRGGGGGAAYAQPLSSWWQLPASMAFVTDSNRTQPLRQPPPTACLTAAGATSEVPSLLLHAAPLPHNTAEGIGPGAPAAAKETQVDPRRQPGGTPGLSSRGKRKKKVRSANRNERSQGRSPLHGHDMGKTQDHRKHDWTVVGGWWRLAVGRWSLGAVLNKKKWGCEGHPWATPPQNTAKGGETEAPLRPGGQGIAWRGERGDPPPPSPPP